MIIFFFEFAEAESKRLMGTGAHAPETRVILRIGEFREAGDCVKETLFFGELFDMITNETHGLPFGKEFFD